MTSPDSTTGDPFEALAVQIDCAEGDQGDVLFPAQTRSSEAVDCEDPFGCSDGAESLDVFVSVDGQAVAIDERFLYRSPPAEDEFFEPGYYMMLEPLEPGDHRIEWGGTIDYDDGLPPTEIRRAINAEIALPTSR